MMAIATGQDAYYELKMNALNTIYEVFWIWKDTFQPGSPYFGRPEFDPESNRVMMLSGVGGHLHPRGERWGFLDWDYPGLRHAVEVQGTLNDKSDVDKGWTAELALPWEGLRLLSDGRALPPKNGDEWLIDCSRFQSLDLEGKPLQGSAGWTWNRHGHYDSHIPERFTTVQFVE
ncbi:MAG: carbohydrate-binding family 9-like protein [bacterium]